MKRPSVKEMCDAIDGVWLELRFHVKAADFRARLQTHRKVCIVREWTNLALIWERYRDDAHASALHFKMFPHVYGESTPEMVARFEGLAAGEYRRKAAQWRGYVEWVWANDLPSDVDAYDPTHTQSELDADEPDRWAGVRLADYTDRVAGWR